jgi:hypothetical protein
LRQNLLLTATTYEDWRPGAREKRLQIRGFPIFGACQAVWRPQRIGDENPCRSFAVLLAEAVRNDTLNIAAQNMAKFCGRTQLMDNAQLPAILL